MKRSPAQHTTTHTTDFVYPCLYLGTRMHAWYGSFRANHCVRRTGREGWSRRVTKRIASQHVRMPANANVPRTWTLQHRQPLRRINWSVPECMSAHSRTDIGAGCHTYCACRSSRMSRPVALPCQAWSRGVLFDSICWHTLSCRVVFCGRICTCVREHMCAWVSHGMPRGCSRGTEEREGELGVSRGRGVVTAGNVLLSLVNQSWVLLAHRKGGVVQSYASWSSACSSVLYTMSFSMRSTCVSSIRRQQYRFSPSTSNACTSAPSSCPSSSRISRYRRHMCPTVCSARAA